MTLLRSTARTMLASYFVVSGLKAVRDPESLVPAAEPLVDGVVPTVQRFAPEQVAGLVPDRRQDVGADQRRARARRWAGPGHRQGPPAGCRPARAVAGADDDRQVPVLEPQRPGENAPPTGTTS